MLVELNGYKDSKELLKPKINLIIPNYNKPKTICGAHLFTVGLKNDGTLVAVGDNDRGQCNVEKWKDVVAISAGAFFSVGLKSDGTVIATEYTGESKYYWGRSDVKDWKNIKIPE